jgi:abortive infection bacteriophage resistance protein
MLKQAFSYTQQIAKLREHGFAVSDEAFCEDVLSRISYYRLSAYFLTFKNQDGLYAPGTDFSRVYRLYEFDRELRRLVFSVLEELEVYLRAQLSYYHTHKYGADGYMNPVNFNYHHNHNDFIDRIDDLVIMELFTFGMLSYFYAEMLTPDQKRVAHNVFKTSVANAKSWLYCCTNLRNLCAHSRRLYNSVFSVIPANIQSVDKFSERKLFAAIMAVRELYPDIKKWNNEFLSAMSELLEEYQDDIQLRFIGFPKNWKDLMAKP